MCFVFFNFRNVCRIVGGMFFVLVKLITVILFSFIIKVVREVFSLNFFLVAVRVFFIKFFEFIIRMWLQFRFWLKFSVIVMSCIKVFRGLQFFFVVNCSSNMVLRRVDLFVFGIFSVDRIISRDRFFRRMCSFFRSFVIQRRGVFSVFLSISFRGSFFSSSFKVRFGKWVNRFWFVGSFFVFIRQFFVS